MRDAITALLYIFLRIYLFLFISTDKLELNDPQHITIVLDQDNWKQQIDNFKLTKP